MMQELTYALKGGNIVADIKDKAPEVQEEKVETTSTDFAIENQDNTNKSLSTENEINTESTESTFEKKDDDEEESSEEGATSDSDDDKDDDDDDKDKDKQKYTVLEEQFNNLQADYTALENEVKELRLFKEKVEPMLAQWSAIIVTEEINDWIRLLQEAISCIPRFKEENQLTEIDNVQYADIVKTQDIPETSQTC